MTQTLAALLVEGLDASEAAHAEVLREAAEIADLEGQLAALVRRGEEAWPDFGLFEGDLVRALGRHLAARPPHKGLQDWLEHAQAEDVHLALACAQGMRGSIEAFERQYHAELGRLLARYQGPKLPREDLLQQLRAKLFVSAPERPAKIYEYSGQGTLRSWLMVTGARTFIDMLRASTRHYKETPTYEEDQILAMPDPERDMELDFLKREYRANFKDAFEAATRQLSSQDRNLLRQHLVAGLTIDQLGQLYNIHRSTAARRVNRARELLLDATRQELMKRLEITQSEFDSIMNLIRSRLDLSMPRLLRSTITEPPTS